MASNAPCLSEERISDVIEHAESEALEGLQGHKNYVPGKIIRGNNSFVPKSPLERVLFDRVQQACEMCYKMAKGTYGLAGGSRKSKKSNRNNRSRRARS